MVTIGDIIRTLVSRLLLLGIMLVLLIPVIILLLLPENWRYDSWYARWCKYFFYKGVVYGSFLPIRITGKEHIPQELVIIVANHQSSLDIPLVGSLLATFPHVWLATNELMVSPILRWILPRITILVDMSHPMEGMRSLVRAIRMINNQQRHVIIFPEGGRHADGNIHEFYGGFALLAEKTGRPVLPVLIQGAYKVYPKGAFWVRYYPIRVVVGEPLRLQPDESLPMFKERVHQWFVTANKETELS